MTCCFQPYAVAEVWAQWITTLTKLIEDLRAAAGRSGSQAARGPEGCARGVSGVNKRRVSPLHLPVSVPSYASQSFS